MKPLLKGLLVVFWSHGFPPTALVGIAFRFSRLKES